MRRSKREEEKEREREKAKPFEWRLYLFISSASNQNRAHTFKMCCVELCIDMVLFLQRTIVDVVIYAIMVNALREQETCSRRRWCEMYFYQRNIYIYIWNVQHRAKIRRRGARMATLLKNNNSIENYIRVCIPTV